MKFLRYAALSSLATLLFATMAFANSKKIERTIQIGDPVVVGNVHLKAGTYKLEWQDAGPKIDVAFVKGNKTVTTAPATLKALSSQVEHDQVITNQANPKRAMLQEIDFSHGKEALIFKTGA